MVLFPPLPAGSQWGFCLAIYCENLVNFLRIKLPKFEAVSKTGSPVVFKSQACPHWAFYKSLIASQVVLPWCWFPWRFLLESAQLRCDFLYLPVSPIFGVVVCLVLPSLIYLRSIVYFSVCWAFYLLWGQNCDFQALSIQNQRLCSWVSRPGWRKLWISRLPGSQMK